MARQFPQPCTPSTKERSGTETEVDVQAIEEAMAVTYHAWEPSICSKNTPPSHTITMLWRAYTPDIEQLKTPISDALTVKPPTS